jgi:hypothetical protein
VRGLTLAWMWLALGLFLLRVLAQIYAGIYAPAWLPAMEQWYSGLLPYPVLLPAQLLLLMLMAVVSIDNTTPALSPPSLAMASPSRRRKCP